MRQQEAANAGEAGVNVFPHILQLFMLVLLHLRQHKAACAHRELVYICGLMLILPGQEQTLQHTGTVYCI